MMSLGNGTQKKKKIWLFTVRLISNKGETRDQKACMSLQYQFVPKYLVQRYMMSWIRSNIKEFLSVQELHPVTLICQFFFFFFFYCQEVRTGYVGPFLCKNRSLSDHTSDSDIHGKISSIPPPPASAHQRFRLDRWRLKK